MNGKKHRPMRKENHNMKKTGIIIAAAIILVLFAACAKTGTAGVEESAVFVDPNAVKEGAYGNLYFEAEGFRFGIYDPMETVLEHVPSNTTFTGESCAFEGEDLFYFFNGFEVMANQIDGKERVTGITVTDDTVKTPDGIYIGMPEEQLREIIGKEPDIGGIYVTIDGTAQRNVTVQDGTVAAIGYAAAD